MMQAAATPAPSRGPWLPATAARPLVAWREAQLRALAAAFGHALAGWRTAWGVPDGEDVSCQPLREIVTGLAWRRLQLGADGAGWLHQPADAADRVVATLFAGAAPGGALAREIAAACQRDAATRLLSLLGVRAQAGADDGPAASASGAWSGVVDVRLPDPLRWRLVLQPAAVVAWWESQGGAVVDAAGTAQAAPLSSARDALANLPVRLEVQLAGCDIDLGALQRLQPGDVVRLEHRIDAPAAVNDAAGTPLFDGYLGRRAGAKAVELGAARSFPPSVKAKP